jgi:4-azaleucine resistance transporter AzlC
MNQEIVKKAFVKTLPVLAGYVVLGTGFGILLRNAGYGVLWAFAMSAFIYAGSMQYVGVSLLAGGASVLTTILTTIMVNARHLFYGVSMLQKYKGLGWVRPFAIFAMTDETFSVACANDPPEGVEPKLFYFWISLLDLCYWTSGTLLGGLAGSILPFDTTGLDFSMTALFVVLLLEQLLKGKTQCISGLMGLGCTALSLLVFGAEDLVLPAMVLILAAILAGRRKLCT